MQAAAAAAPAVRLRGISKRFGTLQANDAVDLDIAAGSIHGLVGENGAGKSTLMSIVYGLQAADAGTIELDGRPLRLRGPRDAIGHGIGMVQQHFLLVDAMSALDNLLLGAAPHWRLTPSRAALRARLEALMADTGLVLRLDAPVAALPVGERQRLEILKALLQGARLLILDEPTAVLTPQESAALFATLRRLRARGTTLVLISHKLAEILALCDRVTVMRGGRVVLDCAAADTGVDALGCAMVGRPVHLGRGADTPSMGPTPTPGPALLEAEGLVWRDAQGLARVDGVSLALHGGEIVGIAGVAGNGQSELLDLLAGLRAPAAGRLRLGGRHFEARRWLDPATARALGLAHVPEDRQRRGLVLGLPAWESAVLGHQRWPAFCGRFGALRPRAMRAATAALMAEHDVRPPEPLLRSDRFSGGNQQKLILAREIAARPQVLLVGQPTRGVDIGAIEAIHRRLRALRDAGHALLLVSSDLDEILALADRVLVLERGRIAGALPIAQCSEAVLGRLMGGATAVGGGSTTDGASAGARA